MSNPTLEAYRQLKADLERDLARAISQIEAKHQVRISNASFEREDIDVSTGANRREFVPGVPTVEVECW